MTAASQRSFSVDGKRLDFSAQTFPLGQNPLDRELLTPEQIAALHKIVAQAQLMATNLSYEAVAGLTSLLQSVSGLRQALTGMQSNTIRAAASNLRDDLRSLKSANPNNPQLSLTLSALNNIIPEKTKNGQVIRLAVVREGKIARPEIGARVTAESRMTGAKVIPFDKAAAQSLQVVERLVPSSSSPLSCPISVGKADLSVLAKSDFKKAVAPAKEPIGKIDPVSVKAAVLAAVDKVALPTNAKTAEAKIAPANVKIAGEKVVTAYTSADVKAVDNKTPVVSLTVESKVVPIAAGAKIDNPPAQPRREARAKTSIAQNAAASSRFENITAYRAPADRASTSVEVTVSRGQPNISFTGNTIPTVKAYAVPVAPVLPVTQNSQVTPNRVANDVLPNRAEQVFKTADPAKTPNASTELQAQSSPQTQQQQSRPTGEPDRAGPSVRDSAPPANAGRPFTAETPRIEIKIEVSRPETPRAEAKSSNSAAAADEKTSIKDEFKIAATGSCAGCSGGDCASCMRPISADTQSIQNLFLDLTEG